MNIRSIKLKVVTWTFLGVSSLIFSLMLILTASNYTSAASRTQLPEAKLEMFAQNNILFYDPSQCISGKSTGVCGSNTKEKLWTALRQHFDEIHTAAALGNILHEGGLNPLRWEHKTVINGNPPTFDSRIEDWNKLYDGTYMNMCYDSGFESWYCIGVGDFAITSRLDEYLQYIEKNEPDLFDYFKDPKYTYMEGDSLIDELGEDIYDRLIALEVKYFIEEWIDQDVKEEFESRTSVTDAARYYSDRIMACGSCHSESVMSTRAASAEEMYDELKGFSCTPKSGSSNSSGSSTSSGTVSGNSITWIGDSYSENSANKAAVEAKYPGIYYNGQSGRMFANDSNRWGASGLNIIGNEIKDDLRDYLVFALGTNTDATSKEDMTKNIDDLVATVKKYNSNTKIILVSPITNNDSARSIYDAYHEAMQEAVEKYDNVILADWYDFAKDHLNEYFDDHSTGDYTDGSTYPNAKGYEKWIGVIADALSSAKNDSCGGGINPIVTVDGNEYMFPLAGASKDNYLHGVDETSVLSPMPCSNYSPGACHHDYVALDMGLRKKKVDGQEKTDADYPDISYDDYYYYSDGVKVLAFVEGEVTYAGYYSNGVPNGYGDRCGQLMYKGVDGNEYWIGHLAYNDSIKAGDTFKLGDVIGEVGPPPCAQGTQSHVHIHISPDSDNNTKLYDIINATYDALPETGSASSAANCDNICSDNNKTGTSGFSSVEEAEKVLITNYNNSDLSSYGLLLASTEGGYHDNCVAFSTWFINHYTEISYTNPPNGNQLVDDFYDRNVSEYPKLKITDTPTVYSVASWSDPSVLAGSSNHTGIVVGIDEANDKILIAEAGWENHAFTGVHEYTYSEAKGHGKYINLNDYLKPNTDLK